MARTKKALRSYVRKESNSVYVDLATGEVLDEVKVRNYVYRPGANYVKFFSSNPLFRARMPLSARVLLDALASMMPYANDASSISYGGREKEMTERDYGISLSSIERGLAFLCKNGYLLRVGRGRYFVNPYLYGKGTAANIADRQKEWDALVAHSAEQKGTPA